MQKPSSKKPIIISVAVILLVGLAYFYFSGSPSNKESSLTAADAYQTEASLAGANVLVLLNKISSLHIDPAIFDSPVYKSLVDHTVIVPEQNVGKINPFLPFFGRTAPPPALPPASSRTR